MDRFSRPLAGPQLGAGGVLNLLPPPLGRRRVLLGNHIEVVPVDLVRRGGQAVLDEASGVRSDARLTASWAVSL